MPHFLDKFDASKIPSSLRHRLAGNVVPGLVRSLEENGLTPEIGHDLGQVREIHDTSDGRMRLFQPFNPIYQLDYGEDDTVVLTLHRDGQPVACAATRLLWIGESLAKDMQSLRLFYHDARQMSRAGESCIVTAPTASLIADCHIALTGAVFVQAGEKSDVVKALMRLLHIWVYAHWKWSWLAGIAEPAVARKYAFDIYGFTSIEKGVFREGRDYMLLVAPRRYYENQVEDGLLNDLEHPLGAPTAWAAGQAQAMADATRRGRDIRAA